MGGCRTSPMNPWTGAGEQLYFYLFSAKPFGRETTSHIYLPDLWRPNSDWHRLLSGLRAPSGG
jgi:hypothetical protein